MIPMTFRGKQQKPAIQCCYVEWSKVRLLVGLKPKKIDQIRHVSSSLTKNGGQKFKKNPKNHETKGVFYRHICSSCFAQDGKIAQI